MALQIRSLVRASGELELSLHDDPIPEPQAHEVVIRVEASPLNPSDLGLLFGAADMSTAKASGTAERPVVTATVPERARPAMAARLDESMPVGNEGAGVVVKAGSSPAAQALLGKTVAAIGGAMYSQYRSLAAAQCMELPEGTTPAEGASCFVNPLTSLSMVETMRMEGHKALVHTAAASNLGQMLNKICQKDGIALVNIVRKQEQEDLLRGHVGAPRLRAAVQRGRDAVQVLDLQRVQRIGPVAGARIVECFFGLGVLLRRHRHFLRRQCRVARISSATARPPQ